MPETTPAAPPAAPATAKLTPRQLSTVLVKGDLSTLTPEERLAYLTQVCESLSHNPLTRPFDFLTQKKTGKVVLYARKDCTEQLRKNHNITLELVHQAAAEECYVVHVRATMPAGKGKRTDEDLGVISMVDGAGKPLRGEDRANAIMHAITKAKRRVTLSICGLGGFLDESEVGDPQPEAPQQLAAPPREALPPPATPPLQQAPPAVAAAQAPAQPAGKTTHEQLVKLAELKKALALDDAAWKAVLAKRGVTTARDLTTDQADDLVKTMQHRAVANQLQADLEAGAAKNGGGAGQLASGFPCPAGQPAFCRSLWPAALRGLLTAHGPHALHEAGVRALGYPAILITEGYELRALEAELAKAAKSSGNSPSERNTP